MHAVPRSPSRVCNGSWDGVCTSWPRCAGSSASAFPMPRPPVPPWTSRCTTCGRSDSAYPSPTRWAERMRRCRRRSPSASRMPMRPSRRRGEYLERGFKVLKVKLGHSLDDDIERLHRLRGFTGTAVPIRVGPESGVLRGGGLHGFVEETAGTRHRVPRAADEGRRRRRDAHPAGRDQGPARGGTRTLLDDSDALALVQPPRACGIFNIKLMKCGGVPRCEAHRRHRRGLPASS